MIYQYLGTSCNRFSFGSLLILLLVLLLSIWNSSNSLLYTEAFTSIATTSYINNNNNNRHHVANNRIININPNGCAKKVVSHQTQQQFKTQQRRHGRNNNNNNLQLQMISYSDIVTTTSISSSSIITSVVDVFDGSDLVNVVVVSNVFWSSLITKIISVVIGQLIASIVFGSIVIFASKQLASFIDTITEFLLSRSISTSTQRSDTLIDSKNTQSSSSVEGKYYVRPDIPKLFICILIDMIGSSSIIIPFFIGDVFDVVWAPIAGIIVRNLFYGNNILLSLEIIEEILPITDILPLATICWCIDTIFWDTEIAKLFKLGRYKPIQYL